MEATHLKIMLAIWAYSWCGLGAIHSTIFVELEPCLGSQWNSTFTLETRVVPSITTCAQLCLESQDCRSFTVSPQMPGQCYLNIEFLTETFCQNGSMKNYNGRSVLPSVVNPSVPLWIHPMWGAQGLFADLTDNEGEVTLESMAKNIVALGSLVQTLSTQVQNLTSQVEILTRKQGEVVSFKAYPSHERVFGLGSTIVFDTVENNVGSGYNPSSGVFHVPITGIYTFTVQIETTVQGTSEFMLYNQAVIESVMTIQHEYDSKTMTVIIHATKGNDVYVKKVYDIKNAPLRASTWTQFSGHLLRAD